MKPNFGHSEGASGITSLIKSVLALEHKTIPPNIKFMNPNPKSKNGYIPKSVFANVVSPICGEKSQSSGRGDKMARRSSLADQYQFFRHWWCKCRKSLLLTFVRFANSHTARESLVKGPLGEIKTENTELTNRIGRFGFLRRQSEPVEWIVGSFP